MAEQSAHDVVNQTQSVGDRSPSDVDVVKSIRHATGGDIVEGTTRTDSQGGEKSDQDGQPFPAISTQYANAGGRTVGETEEDQPSHAEPITIDTNTQDSDFDGNISQTHSAGGLSATSDNDGRKLEQSTISEDIKNQDMSNAAKRPSSFKPVSFAKYSAAKVAGLNSAVKSNADKIMSSANSSTTSLQQGSRPRLVAKSTSGLRDNASKTFKSGSRNTAGGPDPMQVWNKNRPAPPLSTKHLTDEELKQQYGIHMTSRIEADGESKEAKWADIDDDEDDWAPETIEWADGTKVTLNHANNVPPPPEAVKPEDVAREQPKETQAERPKPLQVISSVGPNATVLKLGASAERQQTQKATIVQKGPSEKPATLTAKSPAPVPAKSPWAPLPPVDKISPITINPQIPIPPSTRLSQVQPGGPSPSVAVAPSPAKEMSADDFNRSWRESPPGQPRELFMPNSGRYEAVGESRRRGSRNDQNFRAPALLQRPSPGDQHAPAEPSPAFQTSRMSADQERGPWSRRRASSIHSGGSGQYGRRLSVSMGADTAATRSEVTQQATAAPQIVPLDVVTSARGVHVQQNTTNVPPTPLTAGAPGQSSDMSLIAEQKRLMQESARLAVQRRREEELKEEAARKERIRLKLEQMGHPPDQKAKSKEPKAEAVPQPEESTTQVSSPPKPPVPEASGKPKQYGMMKVHHPDNVKKFSPPVENVETSVDTKAPESETLPKLEQVQGPAPVVNGIQSDSEAPMDLPLDETHNPASSKEETIQAWKVNHSTTEQVPGWSSRNQQPGPPTGNLWGLANHDKGLGNGTFDQRLTSLPARDLAMRNNTQQQNWLSGRAGPRDRSPQMPPTRIPQAENSQSVISASSPEQRPMAANSEADSLQPIGKPLPIGPPQAHSSNQRWQQPSTTRPTSNGVASWNNFHAVAALEDRAENERYQRGLAARLEEEGETGSRRTAQYTFNETWKQVEIGDQSGDRQVTSVAKGKVNPPFPAGHAYGTPTTSLNVDRATNGLPVRGSRFFPTEARRAVTYSHPEATQSPSPPPAEELGGFHPAYDGDAKRPVISLPVPKAVVKLPQPQQRPALTSAPPPPPRTFAAAAAAQPPPRPPPLQRVVSQPVSISKSEWQHRFNDLFGKKPPAKERVLAVASSTREPLDVVPFNMSAAVSLPPKEVDLSQDGAKIASKDVEEEEDLFEDREAGSLPLVQVPRDVPENLQHPIRAPHIRPNSRYFKPEIDPESISSFDSSDDYSRGPKSKDITLTIHLPGGTMPSRKSMPRKGGNGGFASKGTKPHNFNTNHNNRHKKGPPKSREPSSSFHSGHSNTRTPPAVNGSVPTPRSGFPHSGNHHEWRAGHFASAGIAH